MNENLNKTKNADILIDVRTYEEVKSHPLKNSYHIPYDLFLKNYIPYLDYNFTYYLICENGHLSKKACEILKQKGYNCINIEGGINNLHNYFN